MIKIFLLTLILLSSTSFKAQTTFSRVYDHFDREILEEAKSIEETSYGFLIFYTGGSEDFLSRLGVRGIDYGGDPLYLQEYGEPETNMFSGWANSTCRSSAGTYLIGTSYNTEEFDYDGNAILQEFNEQGELLNYFEHDSDTLLYAGYSCIQQNENYYLVGATQDTPNGYTGAILAKINSDFELEWIKKYLGEGAWDLRAVSVVEAFDGGFIIGGRTVNWNSFGNCEDLTYDEDPVILKVDENGEEEWRQSFGTCRLECNAHLARTSDGNYLFSSCLKTDEPVSGELYGMWPYIVKFDTSGAIVWEKTYGEPNYENVLTKIQEISDGNIIAGGYRFATDINNAHRWGLLIKLNQEGDSLWYRKYKFADDTNCFFRDVIETSDGGFAACGRSWPSEENTSVDTWVVKTDEYGCLIPGCHIGVGEFTKKYGSFKVGPNPVRQSENLAVFLPDVKDLTGLSFELRNLQGQLVKSFAPDEGGTSYLLRMEGLSKGMYVLSLLKDGTQVQSEKVVVE